MDLRALAGLDFDAVLFDLDGTLVDSTVSVTRSWTTWAGEFGVDLMRLRDQHGIPAAQILGGLVPPEQRAQAEARITELEIGDVDGIVALPGAQAALAAIPAGRAAIVTSCTRPLAAARIGATGLVAPAVVVVADDVEVGKPDPAPFLLAARRLGVDPTRCLVVEDAPAGLAAAKAAGAYRLAVVTTNAAGALEADLVVPDLAAVRFVATEKGVRLISAA